MQFGLIVDMALVFCFNVIIIGTACWVLLRCVEKSFDIMNKYYGVETAQKVLIEFDKDIEKDKE